MYSFPQSVSLSFMQVFDQDVICFLLSLLFLLVKSASKLPLLLSFHRMVSKQCVHYDSRKIIRINRKMCRKLI